MKNNGLSSKRNVLSNYVPPTSKRKPLFPTYDDKEISVLGILGGTGKELIIDTKARSLHTHVIGGIGSGKSRFLISQIKQDIIAGRGVCLIDPHGQIYKYITNWLVENPELAQERKIHLVDVDDTEGCIGINPLHYDNPLSKAKMAENTALTLANAVGDAPMDEMPTLTRTLTLACHLLAEFNLTLCDAGIVMLPKNRKLLEHMVHIMEDEHAQDIWEAELSKSERMFKEDWGGAINRLTNFVLNPMLRGMFSQTENTLDFMRAMDESEIVLVNLQNKIASDTSVRLIGHLFVDMAFRTAMMRENLNDPTPWYMYIDECHQFLNDNVARTIFEGRKMGLHITLAHQTLTQLREAGEQVYSAVYGSAHNKVVFGKLDAEDARSMAERIFITEVQAHRINHIFDRPYATGEYDIVRLAQVSETIGNTETTNKSSTKNTGTTDTVNQTEMSGSGSANAVNETEQEAETEAQSLATNAGMTDSFNMLGMGMLDTPIGFGADNLVSKSISSSSSSSSVKSKSSARARSTSNVSSTFSAVANGTSFAQSEGYAETHGDSLATSKGTSKGYSEAMAMKYEMGSTVTYSLDEQWHEITKRIMITPPAKALMTSSATNQVVLADVLYTPDQENFGYLTDMFIADLFEKSDAHKALSDVKFETESRIKALEKKLALDIEDNETGWEE